MGLSPYSSVTRPVSLVPDWLMVMWTPTCLCGVTTSTRHMPAAFCCARMVAGIADSARRATRAFRIMMAILLPGQEFRPAKDRPESHRTIRRPSSPERCAVAGHEPRNREPRGNQVNAAVNPAELGDVTVQGFHSAGRHIVVAHQCLRQLTRGAV